MLIHSFSRYTLCVIRINITTNQHPTFPQLPPHCPASVTLQPAPGDTGKPCGVDYELKAYVAEDVDEKPHKRNSVRLAIRKVTYAPSKQGVQPSVEVSKDFVMSPNKLHLEASLDKEVITCLLIILIIIASSSRSVNIPFSWEESINCVGTFVCSLLASFLISLIDLDSVCHIQSCSIFPSLQFHFFHFESHFCFIPTLLFLLPAFHSNFPSVSMYQSKVLSIPLIVTVVGDVEILHFDKTWKSLLFPTCSSNKTVQKENFNLLFLLLFNILLLTASTTKHCKSYFFLFKFPNICRRHSLPLFPTHKFALLSGLH